MIIKSSRDDTRIVIEYMLINRVLKYVRLTILQWGAFWLFPKLDSRMEMENMTINKLLKELQKINCIQDYKYHQLGGLNWLKRIDHLLKLSIIIISVLSLTDILLEWLWSCNWSLQICNDLSNWYTSCTTTTQIALEAIKNLYYITTVLSSSYCNASNPYISTVKSMFIWHIIYNSHSR